MTKTIRFALVCALAVMATPALALNPTYVPTCNTWDTTVTPNVPAYQDATTPLTRNCTDLFGVANWANSPLPVGPIDTTAAGFRILSYGSGYSATPTVSIDDFYNTPGVVPAACTAQVTSGYITGISCSSAGSGYRAPVVNITDATGSGANVLARLASATSGGLRKFVPTDTLPNLQL